MERESERGMKYVLRVLRIRFEFKGVHDFQGQKMPNPVLSSRRTRLDVEQKMLGEKCYRRGNLLPLPIETHLCVSRSDTPATRERLVFGSI